MINAPNIFCTLASLVQVAAGLGDRLLAQLADARVAQLQHQGDFLEAQLMLVVKGQHQPFTLAELAQCLSQQALLEYPFLDRAAAAGKALVTVLQELVEALDGLAGVSLEELLILLGADTRGAEDFFFLRHPAQLARQLANGIANLVGLLTHLTRPPVLAAQLIENRPADAQRGKTTE